MQGPVPDLERLERDAFRRFYEDGIFDIYLGLMLLLFAGATGLRALSGNGIASYVVVLAVAGILTVPLLAYRRRLLRERLGTFAPAPRRRLRIGRTRSILAGSVVVGLGALAAVAVAGAQVGDLVVVLVPFLWLIDMVVVFSAMAYLLDVPRFYAYGIVGGLLMPLMIWPDALWGIDLRGWLIFGLAGAAVTAVGLVKLRGFLRTYPAIGR
jgi:hypothetical protein